MKNKNKNNKNKRSKRTKPRKNRSNNSTPPTRIIQPIVRQRKGLMSANFASQVCGLYNPFCSESVGAKIPDVSSGKTLTMCVRLLQPIGTNAEGNALYIFTGNLVGIGAFATMNSFGDVTASTGLGPVPIYTPLTLYCKGYRVVSFGCKFVPTSSYMNAKGSIIATETDSGIVNGMNNKDMTMAPVSFARSVVGEPLLFTSRVTDLEYTDFKPIDSTDPSSQRTRFMLSIVGGEVSTIIGQVEFIMNVELTPLPATPGAYFASNSLPANPAILNAASDLAIRTPVFHSGSEQSFTEVVENELKSIVGTAARAGGSYLRSSIMAALAP